jgi:GNAT superfamily N-acetyltransferase
MPSHSGPCVDRQISLDVLMMGGAGESYPEDMLDLAGRVTTRAERIDRAASSMHARFAALLPGGEVQEAGHAIWAMTATALPFANGVIRYDARDFQGPESERELDNCLAVLSTYDLPWRFSAWAHLGADLLVPRLMARGMTEAGVDQAMWLDLPGAVPATMSQDGIEVRPAADTAEYRAWTTVFTITAGVPNRYSRLLEQMVTKPRSLSLVAHAKGHAVGCLTLVIDKGLAVVYNVSVLPSARRRGVGRRLLQAAHEASSARGARACVVLAPPEGLGICARLGHHAVTSVTYLRPPPARTPGGQPDR